MPSMGMNLEADYTFVKRTSAHAIIQKMRQLYLLLIEKNA